MYRSLILIVKLCVQSQSVAWPPVIDDYMDVWPSEQALPGNDALPVTWLMVHDLVQEINETNSMNGELVRPVLQQADALNVSITFYLNSMIDFDTARQRMDLVGHFVVEWKDEVLTWEGGQFDGIDSVSYPLLNVWHPNLVIDKAFKEDAVIGNPKTDFVTINRNGTVQWKPSGFYSILCDVDAQYYPFDAQTCVMEIYVSDHTKSSVALTTSASTGGVVLLDYSDNVEWELLGVSSFETVKYDTNYVNIQIQIERMASFTVYTMVIPLLTLSVLSIMTYLSSLESGEKLGLSITVFLAYGFFAVITRDSIPPDSIEIPYIVAYIASLLIINMFTVLYIMIESKIHFAYGQHPCNLRCQLRKFSTKTAGTVEQEVDNKVTKNRNLDQTRTKEEKRTAKKHEGKHAARGENMTSDHVITWSDFLRQVDWFLFVSNAIVLFIINLVFWVKILNRN